MESFLEELEKKYALFQISGGNIGDYFHFSKDIRDAFVYLFAKANDRYYEKCDEFGKDPYFIRGASIEKDKSGNCYLKVLGNDNHTILIIRKDNCVFGDYKNIVGKKIFESEFKAIVDLIQRTAVEKANISNRFLREEVLPLDLCKEMNIPLLISYFQYLNDLKTPIVAFEEPENTVGPKQKSNPTNVRKNPIIDYSLRQDELIKRNPQRTFKFAGNKTGSIFEAYIYERDGMILAVVEPESGIEYQYNLNLGEIDINDEELIKEMIKAALEAREDIVMLDDAIMRKNHTTIEAFSENLDVFLNGAKTTKKFYYDVKNSKSVYGR